MANLNAIYKEDGLQGVIPYAFGLEGPGYNFLCNKLKQGEKLYIVTAKANSMPFYFFNEEKIYFNLYDSESAAAAKGDELARNKFYTYPTEMNMGDYAPAIWKRYRDLGITHIRINDAVWVRVSDLAPICEYEGMLTPETPLRNPTLNAAIYTALQFMEADAATNELMAYMWETVKGSTFYAPIRATRPLRPGESLGPENSDFHFYVNEEGERALLIFTDDEAKLIYAQTEELRPEEIQVVYTPDWNDVMDYLRENPKIAVIINLHAGNMLLTEEIIEEYERNALNIAASGTNNT